MPSLTRKIPHGSDQARRLIAEVKQRIFFADRGFKDQKVRWREAEEKALAFIPERDVDRIRRGKRESGLPQYTTIQIPYSYAVLMAAHTYLTSVFFGRNPVFQFSGRHGETEQQTQALEALIDYQSGVGGFLPPLYTWLYDAGKYGIGVVGVYWEERFESVSTIAETEVMDILGQPTGAKEKRQLTKIFKTYAGNKIFNIQPWDFFWDPRFPAREFQRGEFCGTRRMLSWNELKRREKLGYYMNLEHVTRGNWAALSGSVDGAEALGRPESTDWAAGGYETPGYSSGHPQNVGIHECHVEIIPSEWKLGDLDFPEKWVFTCTADWSVLLGAQPLGAFHCKFPYQVLGLEPEGYGLVSRGIPEILEPVQQTVDWLINSHFYNVRAALNNKYVVDPSRIVMKDLLDPLPGGIIRLKPEAYGQDTNSIVTQLGITDVTQNHLRDLQMMLGVGERTVGVNDQIMGMLNTGGRKTATEIRTSTSFGVNRLKTVAEYFSVTGFDPLSQMCVQNTQQYYDLEQKFKIAGNLVQQAGMGFLMVTPDLISGAYSFVPVDGTLPIDRYAQANLWQALMAQMRNFPEIMLQYDVARIFEWVAQLAGLKNIGQFKAQVLPDQALLMQAKLGNVVPMAGRRGPGGPAATISGSKGNPNEPGQVPGMGPTG